MPVSSSLRSLLFALCVIVVFTLFTGRVRAYGDTAPSDKHPAKASEKDAQAQESDSDYEPDPAEDELAPAAVQLDVSAVSPLLQELYQATRETKEQDVLARLGTCQATCSGRRGFKSE